MTYKLVPTNYIQSFFLQLPHYNAGMSTTLGFSHYFFCLTHDTAVVSTPFDFFAAQFPTYPLPFGFVGSLHPRDTN
uniref:Ovule protein n=1 Tax=Meloidogyne incognita TaxID=6306 RepID=A0A914LET1_MELIC